MLWFRFKTFFQFLLESTNQHGVHSPFVYAFITKCLYAKIPRANRMRLKKHRQDILNSQETLEMTDTGEGSRQFNSSKRKVSAIAKKAGMPLHQSKLINKIVSYFEIKSILELGTSVGLGSIAMATNHPETKVETLEACPETSAFAKRNFKSLNLNNIQIFKADFQFFLTNLPKDKTYDLVYLDGHHQKTATLKYFNQLKSHLHKNSLVIFDDIYWSKAMQEAWQTICKDEDVKVSIDLYFWGIVFFKPELSKQDFKIRCLF